MSNRLGQGKNISPGVTCVGAACLGSALGDLRIRSHTGGAHRRAGGTRTMTHARTITRHSFRASAYALSGRARLLQLELLILEIAYLDEALVREQLRQRLVRDGLMPGEP